MVTPPEKCDDGNTNDLDGCSSDCRCGDGAMGTVAFADVNSGHCYAAYADETTWNAAASLCEKQEAYLASITSKEELDFVAQRTKMFDALQIGANDLFTEGQWSWKNGEPWLIAPCSGAQGCNPMLNLWNPGEPNDFQMNEDCAVLLTQERTLNDWNCTLTFARVCERSP